jgi:hypothetical protein
LKLATWVSNSSLSSWTAPPTSERPDLHTDRRPFVADAEHVHDENCNHDHDHDHEDGEIEITINPREEDLTALGVSLEAFEAALMKTLDAYDKTIETSDPDTIAPLEDAEIVLNGKSYKLQEVADIEISGDLEEYEDDDEDDDEEFDEFDEEDEEDFGDEEELDEEELDEEDELDDDDEEEKKAAH